MAPTSLSPELAAKLVATFSSASIQPIQQSLQLRLLATTGLHTMYNILRHVMASATQAKVGALFMNSQDTIPLRNTLIELCHPQPPTPIQTDNLSTAAGFANDTIKQKSSKAMDMHFYWIKDQVKQGQFLIYWCPGSKNLGNKFTKHHLPSTTASCTPSF
jgi:hypothetical protein